MRIVLLLLLPFCLDAQNPDPFGLCAGYILSDSMYIDVTHKIPNPSFENFACCPQGYGEMDCVEAWGTPSAASPDYFHTCSSIVPFYGPTAALSPYPDGDGIVGGFFYADINYREFISVCLNEPLEAGKTYVLTLYVAAGTDASCNWPVFPPFDLTVFGHPDCGVPNGNGHDWHPLNDPGWVRAGTAGYTPRPVWSIVNIEIEVNTPINYIAIGSPRNIAIYTLPCLVYTYFDGLTLTELVLPKEITVIELGHPCSDDIRLIAEIDTSGGEWQWFLDGVELPGETDSVLDVSGGGYGSGVYSVRYTWGDFCAVTEIEVSSEPYEVVVLCPDGSALCPEDDPILLTEGIPGGGTFSGSGLNGDYFDPAIAGPGSHEITYTVYDPDGCSGSCVFVVEVNTPKDPVCPVELTVCVSEADFELTGGIPFGGEYNGPGVADGWFSPGSAGPGRYEITYTAADANGCSGMCTFSIEVQDTVILTCPDDIYVCGLEGSFVLGGSHPAGGAYSGPGVVGGHLFDPSVAGYGAHEIVYSYGHGVCVQQCVFMIHVNELPAPDCPADLTVCVEDADFTLPAASLPGGVYTGPGVSGSVFSPVAAGTGVHNISYTIIDENLCEATCGFFITVMGKVVPDCPGDLVICLHGGAVTLSGGSPSGGEYSGPGMSGGVFDPGQTGAGVFRIEYSTESQTCGGVCSFEIEVSDELAAVCGELGPLCVDGGVVSLPASSPAGGTYSGPGVSGGQFDPVAAGVGVHTLTYAATDAEGCRYRCSLEVEVLASPVVRAPADTTVCIAAGDVSLTGGSPSGGVYSGPGVSGDRFDPVVAGIGVHALTYSYSDAVGCRASDRFLVTVMAVPGAGIDIELRCHEVDTAYLSAQGVGQWSFSDENTGTAEIGDGMNARTKVYGFSAPGSYVLVWESLGCRDSVTIVVGDDCDCILLGNYIETVEQLFCASVSGHTLTGWDPTPSGGVYQWEWSEDGATWQPVPGDGTGRDYEIADLEVGVYYFRRVYELPDEEDCYSESNVLRLEVVAPLSAGAQSAYPAVCVSSPQGFDLYSLLGGADGGGRWEEISAVPSTGGAFDAQAGSFDTEGQLPGVYLFRYIVTSPAPCGPDTAEVTVLVREDPSAAIAVDPGEVLDCRIMGVTLRAQDRDHVVYSWLLDGVYQSDEELLFVLSGGLYTLIVRDTLTGCEAMSEIRIRDESGYPFVYIADPEELTCARTSIELDGSASQTGANIVHRWLDESDAVLQAGTLYLTVTAPGIYILESADVVNGCMNRDTVEVPEDRRVPVVDAGAGRTLYCGAEVTSLSGTVSGGSDSYDLRWESMDGAIVSGGATLAPEVRGAGRYYLYATDLVSGCTGMDSVEVTESMESIGVTLLEAPPVCAEEATGYIRIETDGEPPLTYEINGTVTIPSSSGRIDGLVPDSYRIRIRDARGCSVDTTVELRRLDPVVVQLPTRVVVDGGDTVHVVAAVDRPVQALRWIRWEPGTDISCDTCLEVLLWPRETREYALWVEDEWGCRGHGVVEVLVRRKIRVYIPEAFSPNGDGINDGFTIYGPDIRLIRKLEVFDRWGDGVFSRADFRANEPEEGWMGKFRDQEMNPAVFVYVAEVELLDGHLVRFHGEVQLVR